MRQFFLFVCGVFVLIYPAVSHAGIIEFLFPSLREEEYDPTKDMIAPFAVEDGLEGKEKLDTLPTNSVSLAKPHLLTKQVGDWVMTAANEAMNFEAGQASQQMTERNHLFDTVGKNQYLAFLREKKVMDVAQDGRFHVRSYADKTPLLLNEGVVNERYRWLFRVPVVVTYMDKDMTTYKETEAELIQRATLNVQVGRVRSDDKPDGLQIEQWSGRMEPLEEPPPDSR